ncbi:MAG: hypothetical protein ACFFCI_02340 [Promethearchaeota archaeon]
MKVEIKYAGKTVDGTEFLQMFIEGCECGGQPPQTWYINLEQLEDLGIITHVAPFMTLDETIKAIKEK